MPMKSLNGRSNRTITEVEEQDEVLIFKRKNKNSQICYVKTGKKIIKENKAGDKN